MKNRLTQSKEHELIQGGYKYAFSLTHNHEESQDLVQDAWLKVYSHKNRSDFKRAYFYTVIRNQFLDQYRRKKRIQMDSLELDLEDSNSGESTLQKLEIGRVEESLKKLSAKEREVFFLKCYEEYTAQEISDVTGAPRGSVLSLVHRAREKLIKLLGYEEGGER